MVYDFKNISLATVCSAKLPLQTAVILAFGEKSLEWNHQHTMS